MYINNYTISVRNNQAFSEQPLNSVDIIYNTLSEWYDRSYSKISILNYIVRNISCYGSNSHPSQTTIGKKAGVARVWANKVTNELVAMGLITKQRVIIDGNEMACEYALTPVLKDPKISWRLKDIIPSLKLMHIFTAKRTKLTPVQLVDNTPYNKLYIYKNFKIYKRVSKSRFVKKNTTPRSSFVKDDRDSYHYSYNNPLRKENIMSKPYVDLNAKIQDVEAHVRVAMNEPDLYRRINIFENMLYNIPRPSQPYIKSLIKKYTDRAYQQST